jgi:hypothetical protein
MKTQLHYNKYTRNQTIHEGGPDTTLPTQMTDVTRASTSRFGGLTDAQQGGREE